MSDIMHYTGVRYSINIATTVFPNTPAKYCVREGTSQTVVITEELIAKEFVPIPDKWSRSDKRVTMEHLLRIFHARSDLDPVMRAHLDLLFPTQEASDVAA